MCTTPFALKAGIKPEVADSIAEGQPPRRRPSDDEEIVVEFATELLRNKQVSDEPARREGPWQERREST
jgi:4-carboxymuconolactone decarboxylase